MKGFGTVVTGTLMAGAVSLGDEVEVLPAAFKARVRGIQVHNESVESVGAGVRTAINLQGTGKIPDSSGRGAHFPRHRNSHQAG